MSGRKKDFHFSPAVETQVHEEGARDSDVNKPFPKEMEVQTKW